jgi:hypothetical protein
MIEFHCKVPSMPRTKAFPCKLAEKKKSEKKAEIFA